MSKKYFCSLLLVVVAKAYGAGFQLFEGNAINVGDFGAGGAAFTNDASASFYNPALLTQLSSPQIVASGTLIKTKMNFRGDVGLVVNNNAMQVIARDSTAEGGKCSFVPALHYARPFNDRFYYGMGLTAPFGLATIWEDNSIVRYTALKSEIIAFNFGPVVAYKINPYISFGGGMDFQYMQAVLTSKIANLPNIPGKDNLSYSEAKGFAYGWNIGLLLNLLDDFVRFGIHYRSTISHHLTGVGEFKDGGMGNYKTDVTSKIKLPDTLIFSSAFNVNAYWTLLGSVYYTRWSTISALSMNNAASPAQGIDIVIPQNFRNTFRYVLGSKFKLFFINTKGDLYFRTGVGYEQTPTNNTDRSMRLPDSDRIALAAGFKYVLTKRCEFDIGYTHLFMKDGVINGEQNTGTQKSIVKGKTENAADLISLQVTINLA